MPQHVSIRSGPTTEAHRRASAWGLQTVALWAGVAAGAAGILGSGWIVSRMLGVL